jgi:peptide/nickel transport system permease protein
MNKRKSDFALNLEKYVLSNKKAKIGFSIVIFFTLVAVLAPVLTPYQPRDIQFAPWSKPSFAHPLGVNSYGQDVFAQVVYGARVTITVSLLAGLLTSLIGVFVGLYAGYKGGRSGEIMMRVVDVFLVLPSLAVMIILAAFLPRMGVLNLVLIIGALSWLWMARSIRAQTLSEARREYVDAAKVLGKGSMEIMFLEILPNILPVVTANMVMVITQAMLTEASLSFLGLGDPVQISWGRMLAIAFDNSAILYNAWYWMLPPGICIATLGFSFVLIGNSFLDIYSKDRGGKVSL